MAVEGGADELVVSDDSSFRFHQVDPGEDRNLVVHRTDLTTVTEQKGGSSYGSKMRHSKLVSFGKIPSGTIRFQCISIRTELQLAIAGRRVFADVALPLLHDRVSDWGSEASDIQQRMLLAGVAVDSPAEAAKLHLGLLQNVEQAKKAFLRGAFRGQTPIIDLYREMSLKSAAYRRPGR